VAGGEPHSRRSRHHRRRWLPSRRMDLRRSAFGEL